MAATESIRPAAYFLVGPTATGKSVVAQWIAERYDWDILSADSMQVYRGMDIGTAKPTAEERARVRYYGLDLVTPDQQYSVWNYRRYAVDVLCACHAAGRRVIVVGGTGLYIKSLTHGLRRTPGPHKEARARWEQMSIDALQRELQKTAPELFESLPDKRNPRRLMRALELAMSGCKVPVATWSCSEAGAPLVGLRPVPELHGSAIVERVEKMYSEGLVDEVRSLLRRYPDLSSTARQAIGYAEVLDLLAGRCTRKEAMARTTARTRQLAKRQRTWFRHQVNVEWVVVECGMNVPEVAEKVLAAWRKHGPTEIRMQECGGERVGLHA